MAMNSLDGDGCFEVGLGYRNPIFVEGVSGIHGVSQLFFWNDLSKTRPSWL